MERRLIASLSGAAVLHAALLLSVALSSAPGVLPSSAAPLVSVDLITVPDEPAPALRVPDPPPQEAASAVVAAPAQPAAHARRTPRAVLAAKGASEASVVPEGSTTTSADDSASAPEPGPAAAEGEGRAPIDLGLNGSVGRWALQAEQDKQRAAPAKDIGGIQSAMLQQDTDNGRGPGFEIAARLIERGRELAPLGSTAVAEFIIEPDGSISSAVLIESSAAEGEWQRVLRDLRQSLPRVRRPPSRRVRAQLSLISRASLPAGGASSGSGISFDLSNIGAAQQHWFHVRVLAQLPE